MLLLIPSLVFAELKFYPRAEENSLEQPSRFRGLKESKNSVPYLVFSIFLDLFHSWLQNLGRDENKRFSF